MPVRTISKNGHQCIPSRSIIQASPFTSPSTRHRNAFRLFPRSILTRLPCHATRPPAPAPVALVVIHDSSAPRGHEQISPRAERRGDSRGATPWVRYRCNAVALKGNAVKDFRRPFSSRFRAVAFSPAPLVCVLSVPRWASCLDWVDDSAPLWVFCDRSCP